MCVHIKAAGHVIGFTHSLHKATAGYLVESGAIEGSEVRICTCSTLAGLSCKQTLRPVEAFCTCYHRMLRRSWCHLLAASELEAFQGMELPAGSPQQKDTDDEVRRAGRKHPPAKYACKPAACMQKQAS